METSNGLERIESIGTQSTIVPLNTIQTKQIRLVAIFEAMIPLHTFSLKLVYVLIIADGKLYVYLEVSIVPMVVTSQPTLPFSNTLVTDSTQEICYPMPPRMLGSYLFEMPCIHCYCGIGCEIHQNPASEAEQA